MIKSGTILIDRSALRPQVFQLEDAWSANAWTSVTLNTHSSRPRERAFDRRMDLLLHGRCDQDYGLRF